MLMIYVQGQAWVYFHCHVADSDNGDVQLWGLAAPGPDPHPNADAWRKLREDAARDPTTTVDAYVLE